MGRLDNKVAVITGSARGIGKGIALRFAREGAVIVLNDIREKEMEATAGEIRDLGRSVIAVMADISTKEGAIRLIDTAIDKFKKVDILVNNAGVASRTSLLETTEEEWEKTQKVDLKGVFLCIQAVAKHMIERKYGKIINISSSVVGAASATVAYSAAKAGALQLTKACALELGLYGINVNCIAPGRVITDMTYAGRPLEEAERTEKERIEKTVLHRIGTVEDIANLALFLASDESSYISAQTIFCDGGRLDRM